MQVTLKTTELLHAYPRARFCPIFSVIKSVLSPFVINSSARVLFFFFFLVEKLVKMSHVIVEHVILAGSKASLAKVTGYCSISYSL